MPAILGTQQASNFPVLYANLCAFVFDYAVRQKVGGVNLNFFLVNQCPILSLQCLDELCVWDSSQSTRDWIAVRVLELSYTAWDIKPFAADCSWNGPPFLWDYDRRFLLRCELDAAFFHLYLPTEEDGGWRPARRFDGCLHDETPQQRAELQRRFPTPRDAVAYTMDTFPIARRKDEERHGEYRTKRVIIENYDAIQESITTGEPYHTLLDPPPAATSRCHTHRENPQTSHGIQTNPQISQN